MHVSPSSSAPESKNRHVNFPLSSLLSTFRNFRGPCFVRAFPAPGTQILRRANRLLFQLPMRFGVRCGRKAQREQGKCVALSQSVHIATCMSAQMRMFFMHKCPVRHIGILYIPSLGQIHHLTLSQSSKNAKPSLLPTESRRADRLTTTVPPRTSTVLSQ